MFAFSFSRPALFGIVAALLLGFGLAFLAGRLTAPREPMPVASERVPPESANQTASAGQPTLAAEAAAAPAPEPGAAPASATPTPAPAPSSPQSPVPPTAKPTPLAAALDGPLERYGAKPAEPAADGKAPVTPQPLPRPRAVPQELNPALGKLADAARPVYTVEVGQYPSAALADAMVQRLALGRYDVYRVAGWSPQGRPPLLSVRVGAFDQRAAAEAAASDLRAREGLEARVLRVDPSTIGTPKKAVER